MSGREVEELGALFRGSAGRRVRDRAPVVPTLAATLGVKGHRPVVGTRDGKDLLHVFGAADCVTGRPHTRTLATRATRAKVLRAARLTGPAGRKKVGKTRRMTRALAAHLRGLARAYPPHPHPRVVLTVDNAPWHRGQPVRDVLAEFPHLELYRLPSYSPELNVIERAWKWLRRRATHNRLFGTLAGPKAAVRDALRHLQRVPKRVPSLLGDCYATPA